MSLLSTQTPPVTGQYQSQIPTLPTLDDLRYENIFKIYLTAGNHYYYNILNTVHIPENIDPNCYYTMVVNQKIPWTIVSFNAYGTIELWWLICIVNQIRNPIELTAVGLNLKIIKPTYVRAIINEIQSKLQ